MKLRLIFVICLSLILMQVACVTCSAKAEIEKPIKRIALTFDDGPHPRQSRQIMDVLDRYQIKATFFVIGVNAKNYPGIVREELERGHEIGNHTNTHSHASRLDSKAMKDQILACEQEIFLQTEEKVKLFRPPEGAMNEDMKALIKELGYTNVLWSLDTRDWAHTPPEQICNYVVTNAKNDDIVLMHDYIGYNSPTVDALELMIPQLLERGFTFVTIGELLKQK